jgi:hypothetical protein
MQFPPSDSWCLKSKNINNVWGKPAGLKSGWLCMCGSLCVNTSVPRMYLFSSYEEAIDFSKNFSNENLVPEKTYKVFHEYRLGENKLGWTHLFSSYSAFHEDASKEAAKYPFQNLVPEKTDKLLHKYELRKSGNDIV